MALQELRVGFRSSMTDLEDDVLLLGRRVEGMVGRVATAIVTPTVEDEPAIRQYDDEVDVEAFELDARLQQLLTLQGPVATDLRLLLSLQKVLWSIERIGDGSLNIARLLGPADDPAAVSRDLTAQLHELALRAERAVRTGLDQFSHRRAATDAVETVERQIDLLHSGLTTRLVEHAGTSRNATVWAINMVLVSRNLERIGDHAVKIAREGRFVVTGERPAPRSRR